MWQFCGHPLFFFKAVPQVSRAFRTPIIVCENVLKKNQLAVMGILLQASENRRMPASMKVCAYKKRCSSEGIDGLIGSDSEKTAGLREHVQVCSAVCQTDLRVCNGCPCKLSFWRCRWTILVLLGISDSHASSWLVILQMRSQMSWFVLMSMFVNF